MPFPGRAGLYRPRAKPYASPVHARQDGTTARARARPRSTARLLRARPASSRAHAGSPDFKEREVKRANPPTRIYTAGPTLSPRYGPSSALSAGPSRLSWPSWGVWGHGTFAPSPSVLRLIRYPRGAWLLALFPSFCFCYGMAVGPFFFLSVDFLCVSGVHLGVVMLHRSSMLKWVATGTC